MKNLLKSVGLAGASFLLSAAAFILVLVGGNQSVPNQKAAGLTNYDEVAIGNLTLKGDTLSMAAGTSTAFKLNSNNFTKFISLANLLMTNGTSSNASYRIWVGTSTLPNSNVSGGVSASSLPLYTAVGSAGLINNWVLATSTVASSTSNFSPVGSLNGAYKDSVFPWKAGEYLGIVLQELDVNSVNRPATSTSRGFNLELDIQSYSTSTVR